MRIGFTARICALVTILLAFFAAPGAPPVSAQAALPIGFEQIASGLAKPTSLTNAGDGSDRLFITEKPGYVRIYDGSKLLDQPFLDINRKVKTEGNEQGLLSVVFHPDYARNGQFFVDYTNNDGDVTIERYQVSAGDPNLADPESGVILLVIDKPYDDHNAGQLAFGPDGYLYISVGDGGAESEPQRNAQKTNTLLGKILRIDIDHADGEKQYSIPRDNPFVGKAPSLPEIWAYGLRNPWRFSFDSATGDLYIGDVGLWMSEEVDVQPAGDKGGHNYGWNIIEGAICHDESRADKCTSPRLTPPIFTYHHDVGCAIVGGYVYHGSAIPALAGQYIFGDYCLGTFWTLTGNIAGIWTVSAPLDTDMNISAFGQDESGELYVCDLKGGVYKIVAAN